MHRRYNEFQNFRNQAVFSFHLCLTSPPHHFNLAKMERLLPKPPPLPPKIPRFALSEARLMERSALLEQFLQKCLLIESANYETFVFTFLVSPVHPQMLLLQTCIVQGMVYPPPLNIDDVPPLDPTLVKRVHITRLGLNLVQIPSTVSSCRFAHAGSSLFISALVRMTYFIHILQSISWI